MKGLTEIHSHFTSHTYTGIYYKPEIDFDGNLGGFFPLCSLSDDFNIVEFKSLKLAKYLIKLHKEQINKLNLAGSKVIFSEN